MLAVVSVLRISLVAVPALRRVEPARTSGPGDGAMTIVCRRCRPARRAAARCAEDPWADPGLQATRIVAAPRDPAAASAARTNRPGRRAGVVLGTLARAEYCAPAAGHDGLHEPGPRAERRRALRRLHDAQPPAGAGADEEEPATAGQRRHDALDGGGDRRRHAADRSHRGAVLAIHQAGDGVGVEAVERARARVDPLGGEPIVPNARRHGAHGSTVCATLADGAARPVRPRGPPPSPAASAGWVSLRAARPPGLGGRAAAARRGAAGRGAGGPPGRP